MAVLDFQRGLRIGGMEGIIVHSKMYRIHVVVTDLLPVLWESSLGYVQLGGSSYGLSFG